MTDDEQPPRLDIDMAVPFSQPEVDGAPTSTPITGGEGYGTVKRRHLLVLVRLPEYLRDPKRPELGIDFPLQGQMLDSDIREAMAKAARKLNDTAMKYSVTGYTWDLNDILYDIPQPRTLSATLVIERE